PEHRRLQALILTDMLAAFTIFWTLDALISVLVLYLFFVGISDGSISSLNIEIWSILLAGMACVLGGGVWLKTQNHLGLGVLLAGLIAVPGLLYAVFFVVLLFANPRWN